MVASGAFGGVADEGAELVAAGAAAGVVDVGAAGGVAGFIAVGEAGLAALLAGASPQAIPRAPIAKTEASAIIFFIRLFSCLL